MQQDGFGCAVTNRFDQLLDDEADPFDILREAEVQKQKKKKKEELKKANAGKQGKKESQKDRRVPNAADGGLGNIKNNSGQSRAPRGGRVQNENSCAPPPEREERRVVFRERRPNQMEGPPQFPANASIPRSQDQWDKGRGRRSWGRGAGEGYPRNPDGFVPGPRREYSGREQSNWVIWTPEVERTDAKEVQEPVETDDPARVGGEAAEGEAEPVPAVAEEMSLDEWKALVEQSRPKEELKLRKVDSRVPSKAMVIHKSKPLEVRPCPGLNAGAHTPGPTGGGGDSQD